MISLQAHVESRIMEDKMKYTQGDINSARLHLGQPYRGNLERLGITELAEAYRAAAAARLASEQEISYNKFTYGEGLTDAWNKAREALEAKLDKLEAAQANLNAKA